MSLKKNQWRVNCGIVYKDAGEIPFFLFFVHELLTSIAITLKLEYAIVEDFSGFLVPEEEHSETKSEFCMDIFCFRAFERTEIPIKDFRLLIDKLFSHSSVALGNSFNVARILQKHLKEVPFPEEFCRPLSYPYVERHNGKSKTLCVTGASYQGVSDDLRQKNAN